VFVQVTDGCDGRGTAMLIWSSPTPPFPLALPRSRRSTTPPTADGPTVRAVEYGTSVQIVGSRGLGPERHSRYLLGEHRSNLSVRLPTPDRGIRAGQTGV